jgi:hypothetical protein
LSFIGIYSRDKNMIESNEWNISYVFDIYHRRKKIIITSKKHHSIRRESTQYNSKVLYFRLSLSHSEVGEKSFFCQRLSRKKKKSFFKYSIETRNHFCQFWKESFSFYFYFPKS